MVAVAVEGPYDEVEVRVNDDGYLGIERLDGVTRLSLIHI